MFVLNDSMKKIHESGGRPPIKEVKVIERKGKDPLLLFKYKRDDVKIPYDGYSSLDAYSITDGFYYIYWLQDICKINDTFAVAVINGRVSLYDISRMEEIGETINLLRFGGEVKIVKINEGILLCKAKRRNRIDGRALETRVSIYDLEERKVKYLQSFGGEGPNVKIYDNHIVIPYVWTNRHYKWIRVTLGDIFSLKKGVLLYEGVPYGKIQKIIEADNNKTPH